MNSKMDRRFKVQEYFQAITILSSPRQIRIELLKLTMAYHGHKVTEPDKDHQYSARKTLTTVDTICPLLEITGK